MADFLKDYEPVEDRLRAFWSEHPDGRVNTELVRAEDGDYIFRADIWRGAGVSWEKPDATGYAHDSTAALSSNMKASALEVCETSAIGRALANLGYAAKGKRPSREEMSKASPQVEPVPEQGRKSKGDGKATGVGAGTPPGVPASNREESSAYGEGADGSHDPSSAVTDETADGEGRAHNRPSQAPSPEEEQQNAYIEVLRSGPGNTQSVLQARALFESDARKVRNLRDLTLDELVAVIQAFKEKVDA